MRANLRELKVLACPFIRDKEAKAVTTVRSHDHKWGHSNRSHVGTQQQVNIWGHIWWFNQCFTWRVHVEHSPPDLQTVKLTSHLQLKLFTHQSYSIQQVLRPCSVALETKTLPSQPLKGSMMVEEVIVKVHSCVTFCKNVCMGLLNSRIQQQLTEMMDEGPAAKQTVSSSWVGPTDLSVHPQYCDDYNSRHDDKAAWRADAGVQVEGQWPLVGHEHLQL